MLRLVSVLAFVAGCGVVGNIPGTDVNLDGVVTFIDQDNTSIEIQAPGKALGNILNSEVCFVYLDRVDCCR